VCRDCRKLRPRWPSSAPPSPDQLVLPSTYSTPHFLCPSNVTEGGTIETACRHSSTEDTTTAETTGDNFGSVFDSVAISTFLASCDPLTHYHQLIDWHCGTTSLGTLKVVPYAAAPPPFALSANHPTANETIHTQPDHEVRIVIDTGASWSVTPCIQDCVSEIKEACETLQSRRWYNQSVREWHCRVEYRRRKFAVQTRRSYSNATGRLNPVLSLTTNFQSPVHAYNKAVRGNEATRQTSTSHSV
jgi:hypothetical protein